MKIPFRTKMHSVRMRTVRSSSRLPEEGCLPGGVFPGACWDMSAQGVSACPVHAGIHSPCEQND